MNIGMRARICRPAGTILCPSAFSTGGLRLNVVKTDRCHNRRPGADTRTCFDATEATFVYVI